MKLKSLLTNGWSGWIRIGVLLIGLGICFANLKADIHLNRVLFERYEKSSIKLMDKFECKLEQIQGELWACKAALRIGKVISYEDIKS